MKKTAAILICCVLLLTGCARTQLAKYDDYMIFGTQARWVYVPSDGAREEVLHHAIAACAEEIDGALSLSEKDSDVSRLNNADAGERVEVSAVTYRALTDARQAYLETNGAYNPAAGLLVDLWGFSPRHTAADYRPTMPYDRAEPERELPSEAYVSLFSSSNLTDFGAVELSEENGRYFVTKPQTAFAEYGGVRYTMQFNLGGIGKGSCVDAVYDLLRADGQTAGYYTVGGSSMALLSDPSAADGMWEVSLNAPRTQFGVSYGSVCVRDTVLSVSGDYEQYYELDGVRYSHIIDPRTGTPVGEGSHVVCATVVGGSAAMGDARATAIVAMDLAEALSYLAANRDAFGAAFIWYDAASDRYTVYSGLGDMLSVTAEGLAVEAVV